MLIKNARVFTGKSFVETDVLFAREIIDIGKMDGRADVDAQGNYVIPGLVDIHTHGAMGDDFSGGRPEGVQTMANYYAAHGVTSYLATTMTLPEENLLPAMRAIRDFRQNSGAKCAGVHLEGPFLGYARRGAHSGEYLHRPDIGLLARLNEASDGRIRMVTVACEEDGAEAFIRGASAEMVVSLGHSSCTYEQAMRAFACGASHVTHLFNGMEGLHHRSPGIVAAAADSGASVELICDGLHIHPAVIRLAYRLYGDRLNLISDSVCCAGMPDGAYELGGQPVVMKAGQVTMAGSGMLAGSAITLLDGLRNAVAFGMPLEAAVYACTAAPAEAVSLKDVGRLLPGKCADLLILDKNLNLQAVFVDGVPQHLNV